MANKNIFFFTSAAITFVAAAAFFYAFSGDYETEWIEASVSDCQTAAATIDGLPLSEDTFNFCLLERETGFFHARAAMQTSRGPIPVTIGFDPTTRRVKRLFLNVVGGPGTEISAAISPRAIYDRLAGCDAVVVSPIYMGSFERSLYPEPSSGVAEAEVGAVIEEFMAQGLQPQILAQSLGGNIVSSENLRIPLGDHLFLAPMLDPPIEVIDYIRQNSNMKAVYQPKYIKSGDGFNKKPVSSDDFNISYFGPGEKYRNSSFDERWSKKSFVSPKARVVAAIAEDEERAGGLEYEGKLENLGIIVVPMSGNHDSKNESERSERANLIRGFANRVCEH